MKKEKWKEPCKYKELNEAEIPFWFWNDELEYSELICQMSLMSESGINCVMPHGRGYETGGFRGDYLGSEWMNYIQTVLEYKRKQDETFWIYDEMDWPAGTCNKTLTKKEDNRERYFQYKKLLVEKSENFTAQLYFLPNESTIGVSSEDNFGDRTLNVFLIDKSTGNLINIKDHLETVYMNRVPQLRLNYHAETATEVYIFKLEISSYEGDGKNWPSYLNPDTTREFLVTTYDKYRKCFSNEFGTYIKGFFNDETRMANAIVWSHEFSEEFKKRKKYDLLPELVSLVREESECGYIKADYFDVVAELFRENYFKILNNWCLEHNIFFSAHLLGEETLASQVRFNGDFMRQFSEISFPGADHLGKGIGSLNLKFTTAAAHSYGKQNVMVEMFAGCGWELTFETYTRMIAWAFQQGITIIINHALFYSTEGEKGNDWPPSQFFQWKHWDKMKNGNELIRRLHYALSGGKPETEVLIYLPTESYCFHYVPNTEFTHGSVIGAPIRNNRAAMLDLDLQEFLRALQEENIMFDLLHKDALENFEMDIGTKKIINSLTGQQFTTLLIPFCDTIDRKTLDFVESFAEQEGNILFLGDVFERAIPKEDKKVMKQRMDVILQGKNVYYYKEARTGNGKRFEEIIELLQKRIICPFKIVGGKRSNKALHTLYPSYILDPYIHDEEDLSGIMIYHYLKDGKRNTFLMNYGEKAEELLIRTDFDKELMIWDPFSGGSFKPKTKVIGKNMEFNLMVTSNYGYLISGKYY